MPIFYMSIFFPKKKGERHALSKQNAMKMLPYRVMTVAVQRKHIPVGSNEKKGRKSCKIKTDHIFYSMKIDSANRFLAVYMKDFLIQLKLPIKKQLLLQF